MSGVIATCKDEYKDKKNDTNNNKYFMNFSVWSTKFFIIENIDIIKNGETNVFVIFPTNYTFYDTNHPGISNFHNAQQTYENGDTIHIIVPITNEPDD